MNAFLGARYHFSSSVPTSWDHAPDIRHALMYAVFSSPEKELQKPVFNFRFFFTERLGKNLLDELKVNRETKSVFPDLTSSGPLSEKQQRET